MNELEKNYLRCHDDKKQIATYPWDILFKRKSDE